MSFKNMKLGAKLGIGFGILISISVLLGVIAVTNMSKITGQSKILATEYIPEVKVASDLRGAANRVMYEMRAYGYTEEKEFYNQALVEIDALEKAIDEGNSLKSRSNHLKELERQLQIIQEAESEYKKLIQETVEVNKLLLEERAIMDASAAMYQEACNDYLKNQTDKMHNEIKENNTSASRLIKITLINNLVDHGNIVRVENYKAQATREPQQLKETLKVFPKIYDKLNEIRKYTKARTDLAELDIIEEQTKNYESSMASLLENWQKREELAESREKAGKDVINACIASADAGLNSTQNIANNSINLLGASNRALVTGLILAIIIGIGFAIILTRAITKPMNKSVYFAENISEGKLDIILDIEQDDEIGKFANALNRMKEKLKEIVEEIVTAANAISGASVQLSESATEQASSTEEVSSSMEEMTSNIQQNTENARETEKIASKAASDIEEGYKAVDTTVNAMVDIAEKISIIEEIAEKTDLLAINAAIEAARAGEHGKGFAVVAVEVRKLAERSQAAAAEINKVSNASVEIAKKSGDLMKEIVPDIQKTTRLVQEIAAASLEQNSGADQINTSITQLNQMNQENASSAEELASMSEQLTDLMAFFDIDVKQSSFKRKGSKNFSTKPLETRNINTNKDAIKINIEDTVDSGYEDY